ncbi:MAG: bifunctional serine/threonine-protein kinase/formylglycine-generating enzyme family protein [Magnetococcus sp. DMHC-6]
MQTNQRYTNWHEIGRGGFGTVHKVYDQALRRFVAIKLLAEKYIDYPELVETMRQEVIISRDLRHPNICPIHDLYEGPQGIGTVMDFISGMELRQWMKNHQGQLLETMEKRLNLFLKLTEALAVAHTRIIHRDLKPANIYLVNGDPSQPMIMDFGASIIGRIEDHNAHIIGTARYMSPEQWEAPHKVDLRSDLFSMGILGYELFTNRIPAVSLQHVQKTQTPPRISLSEIDPPSRFCQILPPALDHLLLFLMAYRQEDRPQSAKDVAMALREIRLLPIDSIRQQNDPQNLEQTTVLLPGGSFYLGSKAGVGNVNEKPAKQVFLSPFRMGIYPVTNQEYQRFIDATGYPFPFMRTGLFAHPNHPVVGVSWSDAFAYAQWVGGGLPSEAQWEYAAKGGVLFPSYPWGEEPPTPTRANINRVAETTTAVGSCLLGKNSFNLFDLCGNVWEWCRDSWSEEFYRRLPSGVKDPCCSVPSEERVLRGGSFDSLASQGRCSFRFHAPIQQRNRSIGFRLVFNT